MNTFNTLNKSSKNKDLSVQGKMNLPLTFALTSKPRGDYIMKLSNGMGSVSKMSGKRRRPWRVRVTKGWTEDGKQIYLNVGYFTTKKEALLALAQYHENPYDIKKSISFSELYDKWYREKEKNHTKKNMDLYALSYKYCSVLYNKPFNEIKKNHLQGMLDDMDASFVMKKKIKTLLNQMFKFAMENDIVNKNYAQFIELKKTEDPKEHIIFNRKQIDYLFSIADQDVVARQALILIYSGMRINEFLGQERESVDLGSQFMKGGSKTDYGRNRTIIIHDRILPFVKEYYDKGCKTLIVNDNNKSIQYKTFYNTWNAKLKEWGFPKTTIHTTRHTFISMAREAKVDELALKRHVGHSDGGDVTNLYSHLSVEFIREEINKIK